MKLFSLDTKVIQTEPALLIELTINNHSDIALKNWLLTTDFNRFILPETLSKGSVKQVGTYTEIKPEYDTEISAGGSYQITFAIKSAPFTNYECGAKSAFLSLADDDFCIKNL